MGCTAVTALEVEFIGEKKFVGDSEVEIMGEEEVIVVVSFADGILGIVLVKVRVGDPEMEVTGEEEVIVGISVVSFADGILGIVLVEVTLGDVGVCGGMVSCVG